MSFFTRLSNGWQLANLSFATINLNRSLLLFPLFSAISLVLVLATFFGGTFYFAGDRIEALMDDEQYGGLLGYGLIFLYYLVNFFVIVFFNAALIHCAIKVLNGEETSVSDGLSFAFSRIEKIFAWSVLSATVGTLLQMLQNAGKIGEFVASLLGIAWSVLTFFVVPILVYEDKGVFESVKASGQLMKQKWGESIAANVSFGLFHFLGIIAAGVLFFLLSSASVILAIVVAIATVLLVSTVITAARTVFVAAVYNHVTGKPAGNFDGDVLDSVFIQK
ncbi:MAG: hypothetical protein DYG98_10640 [Haliscomenobacteraceae bacterium CHB4]|nr:hypothetical protein [Haliscomenobacteraceae bacterium CHB4]